LLNNKDTIRRFAAVYKANAPLLSSLKRSLGVINGSFAQYKEVQPTKCRFLNYLGYRQLSSKAESFAQ
jgi:hypothetical protein